MAHCFLLQSVFTKDGGGIPPTKRCGAVSWPRGPQHNHGLSKILGRMFQLWRNMWLILCSTSRLCRKLNLLTSCLR